MRLFVLSAESIPHIPALVKAEISMAARAGTKILVAEGSRVQSILREIVSADMIITSSSVSDAMHQCDKAIVLWDLRERATCVAIDTLSGLHTPTRIYDMILNRWC